MSLTDHRIAELRTLLARATPGPWEVSGPSPPDFVPVTAVLRDAAGKAAGLKPVCQCRSTGPPTKGRRRLSVTAEELANARLICGAVNALAELLAGVESLRSELMGVP